MKAELERFQKMAQAGEIDLYYGDEISFTLDPCLPYAWQTIGETIEIPAATSERINVFGFFNTEQDFFVLEKITITSEIVAACLDQLNLRISKPTLVVIDQAAIQVGQEVDSRREEWEERGL